MATEAATRRTLEDGAYHYYGAPGATPRLCEMDERGFVFFFDDESLRPKAAYAGKFVKLVEEAEPAPVENMLPR